MQCVEFAYSQTRIQARHGRRPSEQDWQRLRSTHDLGHFLQLARRSPLRPWIIDINMGIDLHGIDYTLRQKLLAYIYEIASWQPKPWRAALAWARWLPYLPALQYLLQGEAVIPWLRDDPVLKNLAIDNIRSHDKNKKTGPLSLLHKGMRRGLALPEVWRQQWRRLWPYHKGRNIDNMESLADQFIALAGFGSASLAGTREQLQRDLRRRFRSHTQQPVSTYLHLALVIMDMEALHAELVLRILAATSDNFDEIKTSFNAVV